MSSTKGTQFDLAAFEHQKQRKRKHHAKEIKETKKVGDELQAKHGVKITVGPIIGKVTTTTAIILLEVDTISDVTVHLTSEAGEKVTQTKRFLENIPATFYVQNLTPGTKYSVRFSGVGSRSIRDHQGSFKTLPTDVKNLRVAIVSCDRPERHLEGEKLMWKVLWERIQQGEIDLMLHVGDQVYAQKESTDAAAVCRHSDHGDFECEKEKARRLTKTLDKARNRLADVYRFTWGLPYTAKVLANVPHLMIWSDNDIFNDFTIAEDCPPVLVKLGQQCYRLYQRALWDEDINDDAHHSEEQHFHKYGSLGIAMLDMRGNRIGVDGTQYPENPIINDHQWAEIQALLDDPAITQLLICSEIPFVSDPPEVVKAGAKKIPFLKDHWAYNDTELIRLLNLLSDWKKAGNGARDFILVGGDIHVGHTSVITDHTNGFTFRQVTTSPITNHVCDFFPKLENTFNEQYSYVHRVLNHEKNYGYFEFEQKEDNSTHVTASLVGSDTTLTFE